MGPSHDSKSGKPIWRHEPLDQEGIVGPGERISNRQILINKSVPIVTHTQQGTSQQSDSSYKESPISYRGPTDVYAEKVLQTQRRAI